MRIKIRGVGHCVIYRQNCLSLRYNPQYPFEVCVPGGRPDGRDLTVGLGRTLEDAIDLAGKIVLLQDTCPVTIDTVS